jgi:D-sedoheptulose 7-phosphate isomerase
MQNYYGDLRIALESVAVPLLDHVADVVWGAWQRRNEVILLGNGGSAATASHIACDLANGTVIPGKARLRVRTLVDNVAIITALANDFDYESVFKNQLVDSVLDGDVIIAISASGNSPNVLAAVKYALSRHSTVIGLCGFGGGQLRALSSTTVWVDSRNYGIVEDVHLSIGHAISQELRRRIESSH